MLVDSGLSIRHNDFYTPKYGYDQNYFKSVDNEHKAYWLGFIAADGCVKPRNKSGGKMLSIALSSVDRGHLEKFKKDIGYTGDIKDYTSNHNKPYSRIVVNTGYMGNDLENLGVRENKSLTIQFSDYNIPDYLLRHFIRGYFDGNGCLTYIIKHDDVRGYKISFCSTENMLRGIEAFFGRCPRKLGKRHHNGSDNYDLCIGGNKQVARALDLMYSGATIYLERKHKKYLEFLQYYENSPSRR